METVRQEHRIRTQGKAACFVDSPRPHLYNGEFALRAGGFMYAIIRTGGKQYRVAPGEIVKVETLPGDVGAKVTFEDVLAVRQDDRLLGKAAAAKAKVTGTIVEQGRHKKIVVLKYKRTNQYKIQRGHRQNYTAVQVSEIKV